IDGIFRIEHSLAFSELTHQALAGLGESYNRRGQTAALAVDHHRRLPGFHHCQDRVCCPEVDSDCFGHEWDPSRNNWSLVLQDSTSDLPCAWEGVLHSTQHTCR